MGDLSTHHVDDLVQECSISSALAMYTALQKFGITLVSCSTRGNTATQMTIFFKNMTQNIFKFRMINARYMVITLPWSYL